MRLLSKRQHNSRKKSLSVVNVLQSQWAEESRIAQNMELTLSSSNANSAAPSLNGSAGVTPISASHATKSSVAEIIFQESPKTNYQSAPAQPSAP